MKVQSIPYFSPLDAVPLARLAELPWDDFRANIISAYKSGERLAALFGVPLGKNKLQLFAVLCNDNSSQVTAISTSVSNGYASITPDCPQAHWFEREIAEQWAVKPEGHPFLKPIRFHPSYAAGHDVWNRKPAEIQPCVTDYFRMQGEETHQVAVGPVHAGIIEPGHFRFQCHGEHVFNLEIELGYQHRGVERRLVGGPNKRTLPYMETLSGDTSIGHALAYCQILETLSGYHVSARADAIRAIALELERLANHTGDLGALANDVAYLPTASFCGRLRGDFLNMTGLICGNRFGRGLLCPGGVNFDIDGPMRAELLKRLDQIEPDVRCAITVLWRSASVIARFEDTGVVSRQQARELGLVGPAARASGIDIDARRDFPSGSYKTTAFEVAVHEDGDVFCRAYVRWLELQESLRLVRLFLNGLPEGQLKSVLGAPKANGLAVSLIEGWRGEICHVALTNQAGKFLAYKVVDPSFHNWMGLSLALRNQQISDFPLCNKSFNLSYCGHDL